METCGVELGPPPDTRRRPARTPMPIHMTRLRIGPDQTIATPPHFLRLSIPHITFPRHTPRPGAYTRLAELDLGRAHEERGGKMSTGHAPRAHPHPLKPS